MTSADPRFVEITNELADAVAEAVPAWFGRVAETHLGSPVLPPDWEPAVAEAATSISAEIRELAMVDIDRHRSTPLSSIRRLATVATPLVRAAGATPVGRDAHAAALHPDDPFDLTPGGFSDLGDRVQTAGLTWGAAKAHLHLERHRPEDRGTTP